MQWEGTGGCKGWYWEEKYVQHVRNSVTQEVAAEGDEAVSQRKKPITLPADVQLSILVGIGRELIMLFKYILVLVFLLLAAVVFVVVRIALCNNRKN